MEKTNKNKEKDRLKREGKIWVDEHITLKKRFCSHGLTFCGHYEIEKIDK